MLLKHSPFRINNFENLKVNKFELMSRAQIKMVIWKKTNQTMLLGIFQRKQVHHWVENKEKKTSWTTSWNLLGLIQELPKSPYSK